MKRSSETDFPYLFSVPIGPYRVCNLRPPAQGLARSEAVSGEMARNNWPLDPFTAGCSIGTPTSETVSAPQPHI
ncbi:hypothetical protein SFHH103_06635 (plasmid) [Sinorhizobium fredii HH103]|uniref:Uncharacterized protein n=1 Tax=Sinorhizobium fredii (strain HH103) TaxID=1117943 RepID=G9AJ61_SINF1|nr:hypothetical protein SFHH103_06635 [Sinorhizobium fredii HH103]